MARAHAIVVGSGLSGLLAARAVADVYERVTVLEAGTREPVELGRRRPDAGHLQILQPPGTAAIENLEPGIAEELREAGVPVVRTLDQLHMDMLGHVLSRAGKLCAPLYMPATATLADHVAARLPRNVEIRDRARAIGLTHAAGRISGVRVETWGTETVPADLVVDASGSAGVCAGLLAAAGLPTPQAERLDVDLHYTSLTLDRPSMPPARTLLYFTDPYPGRPVGAGLGQVAPDRWVLTIFGYGQARPPVYRQALLELAAELLPAEAMAVIESATPAFSTVSAQIPAAVRHRWDLVEGLPNGLVAVGESWCTANPAHGHGMMVSAVGALSLRAVLAEGDEAIGQRYFAGVAPVVEHAWRATLGSGWAYPDAGDKLATAQDDAMLQAVLEAAEHDTEVVNLLLSMNWGIAPPGKMSNMRLMNAVAKSRRTGKRDARREARVERKGARVERRAERKQRRVS